MKKTLPILALLFFVCITPMLPVAAQDAIPVMDLDQTELNSVWQQDFRYETADISWTLVSSSGTLILAVEPEDGNAKIQGYDQNNGNLLFSFSDKSAKSYTAQSFEEIPNTPLIVMTNTQKKQDQIVINTLTGEVAAESKKADMTRVNHRFVLMRSEKILFVGRKGMKSVVAMFDMATGEFWRKEKMFRNKGVEERINSTIVEFNDKSFLISTESALYCVSSETGETVWRAGIPAYVAYSGPPSNDQGKSKVEDIPLPPAKIFVHPDKPVAYYLSHMGLMAYDINTGEKKWKKFKTGDGDYAFLPGQDHLIIVGAKTNGYHYETAEPMWDKPAKIKGVISHMGVTGNYLVFASESQNAISKNFTYDLNAIDLETGLLTNKKYLDANGAISTFLPCESGALYLTDKEINIYDISTGEVAFKDPVTVRKGSQLTDALKDATNVGRGSNRLMMTVNGSNVYFYNTKDNKLYTIDLSNNTIKPLLSGPLPFGNKEEDITTIKMRNDNIYLSSEHNLYLISSTGTLLYHTYYSPIEGLAYHAYTMLQLSASMAVEIAFDAINREIQKKADKIGASYSFETRFNGTTTAYMETNLYKSIHDRKSLITQGNNTAIIHGRMKQNDPIFGIIAGEYLTTKKPMPDINRFLLAQVNKDSGETEKIYDLGGGKDGILPAFSIDEVGGKFYLIKGRHIYCFSL